MRIVIIGNGKVGYTLAENLSSEKHDVTIIDNDDDALLSASEQLDVMYIRGNGASLSTLGQANAGTADVVIAVTTNDEVNMLCCITSKKLGARHTIARIRDPEYVRDVDLFKRQLDIDLVINPERSTAGEILRLLRFPSAAEIDTFSRGRVELIGFRAAETDAIIGLSLIEMRRKVKASVLVCAAERDGKAYIPRGDFVIEEDDLLYIAGKYTDITKFFRSIGRVTNMASNVMILGGGRISYYLAKLADNIGIKQVIIERDENKCRQLAEELSHATVINGDGTEQELLETENINGMDAFVALSGHDEENLMISLFANQCGVRKVIAKANRDNYISLIKSLGVESIISPKEITANHILHFVRSLANSGSGSVVTLHRLLDGRIEALEFRVGAEMHYLGKKIKDIPIKRGVVVAVISRGAKNFIPEGEDRIEEGDSVVIVTNHLGFSDINEIFEK